MTAQIEAASTVQPMAGGAPAYLLAPKNFKNYRKALAAVRAGTGFCDIAFYGDSTTFGSGSGSANPPTNGLVKRLQALLNSWHVPAAEGTIFAQQWSGTSPVDTRWTLGAGWSWTAGTNFGLAKKCNLGAPTTATGSLALAPGFVFDSFRVLYAQGGATGSTAINVDGGATLATLNTSGANGVAWSPTYTVARAVHTINFGAPTVNTVFIIGVQAWDSTTPAVRLSNGGVPVSATQDWIDNGTWGSMPTAFAGAAPNLAIIDLGINDAQSGTALATTRANLVTLIQSAQAANVDLILASMVPTAEAVLAGITNSERAISQTLLSLALQYNCGFISKMDRWTDWATSNGLGLYSDNFHPNGLGYADLAEMHLAALRVI